MAGWIDGSSSILVSSLGSNNRRSVSRDNSSISKSLHLGNMLRLVDGSRPVAGWIDGSTSIVVSLFGSCNSRSVSRYNSSVSQGLQSSNRRALIEGIDDIASRDHSSI